VSDPFKKSWIYFAALVLVCGVVISIACLITNLAIGLLRQSVRTVGLWGWLVILTFDLALIVLSLLLLWKLCCEWKTVIDEDGVAQLSLSGMRLIRWTDVAGFTLEGQLQLYICGLSHSIVIFLGAYRSPMGALEAIMQMMISRKSHDQMMTCRCCGTWNPEGTAFCPHCGMHAFEAELSNRRLNWHLAVAFGMLFLTLHLILKAYWPLAVAFGLALLALRLTLKG
jgi:hypothetical protein